MQARSTLLWLWDQIQTGRNDQTIDNATLEMIVLEAFMHLEHGTFEERWIKAYLRMALAPSMRAESLGYAYCDLVRRKDEPGTFDEIQAREIVTREKIARTIQSLVETGELVWVGSHIRFITDADIPVIPLESMLAKGEP